MRQYSDTGGIAMDVNHRAQVAIFKIVLRKFTYQNNDVVFPNHLCFP